MTFDIIFIKSAEGFNKKRGGKIEKIIKNTANHAVKILNLGNNQTINFTVYPINGKFNLGFAQSKDWIQFYVLRKKIDEDDLKSAVYHEMHHLARGFTALSKRSPSLLETLFSEGLAVVFEMEQVPKRIPIYAKYTNFFIKKWLPQLKKENIWGTDFSHDEWFWGKKEKPYRLGYKLGTYLVHQIKKNHPETTALKLARKDTKTLLKLSGVNL